MYDLFSVKCQDRNIRNFTCDTQMIQQTMLRSVAQKSRRKKTEIWLQSVERIQVGVQVSMHCAHKVWATVLTCVLTLHCRLQPVQQNVHSHPQTATAQCRRCYYILLCLRHRKPSALEAFCFWVCPSVSESVSMCVPKTFWTSYLKNQWSKFHRSLVTCVGYLCSYVCWLDLGVKGRSKVKVVKADNDPKDRINSPVLTIIGANFTKN